MTMDRLLRQFARWADEASEIAAIGLCGSHARGTAKPSSDVDLIIVAGNPTPFLEDTTWAHQFGRVTQVGREDYGLVQSIRVFYAEGPEVEFGWTSREWCRPPIDHGTARVISDGLRTLYDPNKELEAAIEWVAENFRPAERN